jgi:exonuclease VII small subunit
MKHFIQILIAAITLLSCSKGTYSHLQEIESYIEEDPKRALEEIRNITPDNLLSPRTKAKHALLHSMALDKNYIDLTTDSIIAPAVKYYSKHGSADDRLLMHYYMGRIYANTGNLDKAAIEYTRGEELVDDAENKVAAGRLYIVFATVYNKTNNAKKEIEYAQKGYAFFKEMNYIERSEVAKGKLAMAYANNRVFNEADSLFEECLEALTEDTVSMAKYLGHYARLNVLKPDPEPEKAILLLERRRKEYNKALTPGLYCVYAYALQQLGRLDECDNILEQLKETGYKELDFWQYRIYKHRNQYEQAMAHLENSAKKYEYQMISLLSDNTDNALKDYYSSEAEKARLQMKLKVSYLLLALVLFAAIAAYVIIHLARANRKKAQDIENSLLLYENVCRTLEVYGTQCAEQNNSIDMLRSELAQSYKKQFSTIGELCLTYLTKQDKKDVKDHIYKKVVNMIANISDDKKLHKKLEDQINSELDNILINMRVDMPDLTYEDMRFISYCIVGFDATIISTILNISCSNVYTKKSRFKSRIKELDSPRKEHYLRFI